MTIDLDPTTLAQIDALARGLGIQAVGDDRRMSKNWTRHEGGKAEWRGRSWR